MSKQPKPTRYWYEYRNEKCMIPEHFVYQIHPSMGGGFDISEAFFTWAFQKHSISITDIQVLYSNDDRSKPKSKEESSASSTFFIAVVKGKDKFGIEKVGDGEVGSESINNFQRKFPAGLAVKRAKVNMGKEFLNLVDLRLATDCRDYKIDFGEYKGKTLEEMSQTKEGLKTLKWIYSDSFTGDAILKFKVEELFIMLRKERDENNQNNQSTTNTVVMLTDKQKESINRFKGHKDVNFTEITKNLLGDSFTWDNCTESQGNTIINYLESNYSINANKGN